MPPKKPKAKRIEQQVVLMPALEESAPVVVATATEPPPLVSAALRPVKVDVEWGRSQRLEEVVFPPSVGTELCWVCFEDLLTSDERHGADDDINLTMVEVTTQGDASSTFTMKDVRGHTRDCTASEVLTGLEIHNDVVRQFALEGGDGDGTIEGDKSGATKKRHKRRRTRRRRW
jgi:hypothetical protein